MIDFWFTTSSSYSYLSATRLPEVAHTNSVPFRRRPFNLRTILAEMNHIPFSDKPAKCAYTWRDIERRAAQRRYLKVRLACVRAITVPIRYSVGAVDNPTDDEAHEQQCDGRQEYE